MNSLLRTAIALVGVIGLCTALQPVHSHAQDPIPLRVFVMAGQSNMVGAGELSALQEEPVDFTGPFTDTPYWFRVKTSNGLYKSTTVDELRPLFPGFTGTTYGSEIPFAMNLNRYSSSSIAIIKVAYNGSNLVNDWHPSGENGTLYQILENEVDEALAALTAENYAPNVEGFVWVQGTGDAFNADVATQYEANLNLLISEFRDHVGVSDLPVLLNRYHINANRSLSAKTALRASQQAVADADDNVYLINNDDQLLKRDRIHFPASTQFALGGRFATEFLANEDNLLLGDFNLDGTVDGADYTVWQRDRSRTYGYHPADANQDLVVDDADHTIWREQFGMIVDAAPATDLNGDQRIDEGDLAIWQSLEGTSSRNYSADANGDGAVDQADYDIWEANLGAQGADATSGDFNRDGSVDAADYTIWSDTRLKTGFNLQADANSDAIVNDQDLLIWRSNFGSNVVLYPPGDFNRDGTVDNLDLIEWNNPTWTPGEEILADLNSDYVVDDADRLIIEEDLGLRFTSSAAGDFNRNGIVDAGDYNVWRAGLGVSHDWLITDVNSDLIVDELDLEVWRANFGRSLASIESPASVPEPASLVVSVIVISALCSFVVRERMPLPRCLSCN